MKFIKKVVDFIIKVRFKWFVKRNTPTFIKKLISLSDKSLDDWIMYYPTKRNEFAVAYRVMISMYIEVLYKHNIPENPTLYDQVKIALMNDNLLLHRDEYFLYYDIKVEDLLLTLDIKYIYRYLYKHLIELDKSAIHKIISNSMGDFINMINNDKDLEHKTYVIHSCWKHTKNKDFLLRLISNGLVNMCSHQDIIRVFEDRLDRLIPTFCKSKEVLSKRIFSKVIIHIAKTNKYTYILEDNLTVEDFIEYVEPYIDSSKVITELSKSLDEKENVPECKPVEGENDESY